MWESGGIVVRRLDRLGIVFVRARECFLNNSIVVIIHLIVTTIVESLRNNVNLANLTF